MWAILSAAEWSFIYISTWRCIRVPLMAVIDFVLSEKGQQFWAENYLRPVLGELPASAKEKFLPDSEYKRAIGIDYARMAAVQESFGEAYLKATKG